MTLGPHYPDQAGRCVGGGAIHFEAAFDQVDDRHHTARSLHACEHHSDAASVGLGVPDHCILHVGPLP